MPDLADDPEHRLTLRQASQAREDFAILLDGLDFMKMQLSRVPTRAWLSRMWLLGFGSLLAVVALLFDAMKRPLANSCSVTKIGFHAEPSADARRATVPQHKRWVRVVARAQTGRPGRPDGILGNPWVTARGVRLGEGFDAQAERFPPRGCAACIR